MALFEFRCADCGNVSEHLVFSEGEKPTCPDCGSGKLEKMLSTFAVSAKASGGSSCSHAGSCGSGGCGMM